VAREYFSSLIVNSVYFKNYGHDLEALAVASEQCFTLVNPRSAQRGAFRYAVLSKLTIPKFEDIKDCAHPDTIPLLKNVEGVTPLWAIERGSAYLVPAGADAVQALRIACENGHLDVAQWLVATFGLTADDARARNNYAFRASCIYGHVNVAQWLVATFGLIVEGACVNDNYAFYYSC
jgi:hypothetical protein